MQETRVFYFPWIACTLIELLFMASFGIFMGQSIVRLPASPSHPPPSPNAPLNCSLSLLPLRLGHICSPGSLGLRRVPFLSVLGRGVAVPPAERAAGADFHHPVSVGLECTRILRSPTHSHLQEDKRTVQRTNKQFTRCRSRCQEKQFLADSQRVRGVLRAEAVRVRSNKFLLQRVYWRNKSGGRNKHLLRSGKN